MFGRWRVHIWKKFTKEMEAYIILPVWAAISFIAQRPLNELPQGFGRAEIWAAD